MLFHGTYVGFFFDVVFPIASSISFRSSGEMRGWEAGVSKMITNHKIDQINPIPPKTTNKITRKIEINAQSINYFKKKNKKLKYDCNDNMNL